MNETPSADPRSSSADLLPQVYEELRKLAAARLARESSGQTLQATALVHETWLRLGVSGERRWMDQEHFFRAAAQAMRWILVDRARHKQTLKFGGEVRRVKLEDLDLPGAPVENSVLLIDEALRILEAEDPESAHVVQLKFFAGLGNQEAADSLGISLRSLNRQWSYARIRLFQIILEIDGDADATPVPRSP